MHGLILQDLLVVQPDLVELRELGLHELLDRGLVPHDEALLSEAVLGVLQKLSEGDAKAPWVRLVCLQPLDKDPCDLLLHTLFSDVVIKIENHP